jgi:quercetin dioxygenase-like cupin family protein
MEVRHAFGGGVYAKATSFEAGEILVQHKHKFDHLSILAVGNVWFFVEGEENRVVKAPAELLIKAGKHHSIQAMTDGLWYCIHQTDCTDADAIDHTLIEGA